MSRTTREMENEDLIRKFMVERTPAKLGELLSQITQKAIPMDRLFTAFTGSCVWRGGYFDESSRVQMYQHLKASDFPNDIAYLEAFENRIINAAQNKLSGDNVDVVRGHFNQLKDQKIRDILQSGSIPIELTYCTQKQIVTLREFSKKTDAAPGAVFQAYKSAMQFSEDNRKTLELTNIALTALQTFLDYFREQGVMIDISPNTASSSSSGNEPAGVGEFRKKMQEFSIIARTLESKKDPAELRDAILTSSARINQIYLDLDDLRERHHVGSTRENILDYGVVRGIKKTLTFKRDSRAHTLSSGEVCEKWAEITQPTRQLGPNPPKGTTYSND